MPNLILRSVISLQRDVFSLYNNGALDAVVSKVVNPTIATKSSIDIVIMSDFPHTLQSLLSVRQLKSNRQAIRPKYDCRSMSHRYPMPYQVFLFANASKDKVILG